MPIKGLTDRPPRLPRIGKIHLGVKVKQAGKAEYPKATDYFVFDPKHPQYEELKATYGDKPNELRILIPVEDDTKFASQFYRLYSRTRGLVCKGDGETALRMVDTATGAVANRDTKDIEMRPVTCEGRKCPEYGPRACGEVMNLQFLLPEVSGFGVWQIDTGSINSIININSALELVRSVYSRVSMVPLILALEPREVVNPDDGKKKTVRVLNIRSTDKMIEAYRKAQMPALELVTGEFEEITNGEAAELPPAGDEQIHSDLPEVKTTGPGTDTDLWPGEGNGPPKGEQPPIGSEEYAAQKARTDLTPPLEGNASEAEIEKGHPKYTLLPDEKAAFPTSHKDGDIVIVKTTGDKYVWRDAKSNWVADGQAIAPKPVEAKAEVKEPVAGTKTPDAETEEHFTPPEPDQPWPGMTFNDFIKYAKGHGKTEGWLFRNCSLSVAEAQASPYSAALDIKQIAGW